MEKTRYNEISPKRQSLGFFNQLLVGGVSLNPHHNSTLLGVNLGVQLGIPDEVDNPSLRLIGGHVELLRQHGDGDTLVDTTESLEYHHPRVLNVVVQTGHQEEIIDQDGLAVSQLLLGSVKIKIDVEILDEAGDGVAVGVGLLLDDLDQVLHDVPPRALVADDSGGEVPQYPGTSRLDSVQIRLLVEEQVDDQVPSLGMVEEHEETPVDEPGSLLQGLQVAAEGALINEGFEPVEILQSSFPVLHEDLGRQLPPHPVQIVLVRGLDQDPVEVQILAGPAVVAALVLELSKVVAGVDHARLEVVALHEEVQQLLAVPARLDLLGDLGLREDPQDGIRLGLQLLELLHHTGSLVHQALGDLLVGVQGPVHIHSKVHHAGVGQQVQLASQQIRLVIICLKEKQAGDDFSVDCCKTELTLWERNSNSGKTK